MGFWSSLLKVGGAIGSVVAAPFTAGTSLAWLPAVLGGASAAGSLIGAKKTASTATKAAQGQLEASYLSNDLLRDSLNRSRELQQPFINLGNQATSQLSAVMDPNNPLYQSEGFQAPEKFKAPNPQDVLNDPSIQFTLDLGQKAIERSASAKGGLNSGATLKRVNQFAQGVASQGYSDLYSRQKQQYDDEFNRAFGIFTNTQAQRNNTRDTYLNQLNNALQSGQSAATTLSGLDLGVVGQQGANVQGGADAVAAGRVAGSNAYSGAFTDIAKNVMDLFKLSQLNKAKQPEINV